MFLVLAIIAIGVAFYLYQRNIAPIPVTAADLDKGGSFSDAEKAALTSACSGAIKKDTDKVCGCLVDKAGTDLSRYERMMMTATFQAKLSDLVAIGKGLIDSGVPADKVKAAEQDGKQRLSDISKACGIQ
jgi:hypothetical protein